MNFDQAFTELIGTEGGYSNRNPIDDPGGETMWGVTLHTARESGYEGDMRDLPQETAKAIYAEKYWHAAHCDDLPALARFNLFDAAVNHGPEQAMKLLQDAAGVDADGKFGPHTQAAVAAADPHALMRRFNAFRIDLMVSLINWHANAGGWMHRVAKNLRSETA